MDEGTTRIRLTCVECSESDVIGLSPSQYEWSHHADGRPKEGLMQFTFGWRFESMPPHPAVFWACPTCSAVAARLQETSDANEEAVVETAAVSPVQTDQLRAEREAGDVRVVRRTARKKSGGDGR